MRIGLTGISGSLGTALTATHAQAHVIVGITRDELKAEKIMAAHGGTGGNVRCMVISAGLEDYDALVRAFDGCELIIHAAALKRISSSVYTTEELIKTNIIGTMNVLHAARAVGAKQVIVVSSDKAVEATNLYGSTKFCAECLAVQENAFSFPKGTKISVVRYGNVLGSRGSVVHIWREQIAKDLPVTITHKDMTRFIVTMQEAVALIDDAANWMKGGEIFVPRLRSASMPTLAAAVLKEAGIRELNMHEIGLRPGGEKMHESLLSQEEFARTMLHRHAGHFIVQPSHRSWSDVPYAVHSAKPITDYRSYSSEHVNRYTIDELVELLKDIPRRPANE